MNIIHRTSTVSLFLVVFGILFLGNFIYTQTAQAEIKHPYVVDEKPQVIFGDSVQIVTPTKTYRGLENYTQNYVNGYAHITFTYTHDSCCYASYPPSAYITNVDPRTTPTPIERDGAPNIHYISPSENTNWYSYDVQFDSTGYRVIVKKAGETLLINKYVAAPNIQATDWISIVNLMPAIPAPTEQTMAFTPVKIKENATQTIDPVIIVPGILGSANKNGTWVIDPVFHVYDNLIETLKGNGYTEGVNLFPLAYDWRNANEFTAGLLKQRIDSIKLLCGCNKVDIVAHSMGGLITRSYAQSSEYDQDIDQLVFLGTPHKGAPKSYLMWEAGEFGVGKIDNYLESRYKQEAKIHGYTGANAVFNYIKGWPVASVEQLLPTYNYLKSASTSQMLPYPTNYPRNTFLENLNAGLNAFLASGIDITNMVGKKSSTTISTIRITNENKLPLWQHGYPQDFHSNSGDQGLELGAGDGTVPETSSKFGNVMDMEITNSNHQSLPTNAEEEIYTEIHGGTPNNPVKKSIPTRMLFAKIFSPADFVVIAPNGKKIGKNFVTNQEINEIPGAFYSGFATDDEYVTIPDPLPGEYRVQLKGTGNGAYSFETTYITDTALVTTETSGTTTTNQITDISSKLDTQNPTNNTTERKVTVDLYIADINGAHSLGWIKDTKTKDALIKKAQSIIKLENKGTPKAEKKIDKILVKLLEKELDTLLAKGAINQQAYDLLKKDLSYIHNNN